MNVTQELGDSEIYNYDVLVKLLSDRFDPGSRVSAFQSRFHGRFRRHHEDVNAFADALAELCRVAYSQSPPELRQELIAEQFVRWQSNPELKKYLWVVIRTQKDRTRNSRLLLKFVRISPVLTAPTHTHRPAEQTFAVHHPMEASCAQEDCESEAMFAVGNRPPWTGRGASEPSGSPTLQQMFALARRMGYKMRPIARQVDTSRQPQGNRPFANQDREFRPQMRAGWDYSKVKCFSCGQFGHMQSCCPRPDAPLPFKPTGWYLQSDSRQQKDGDTPPGKLCLDWDLTHTGLYALHSAPILTSLVTSSPDSSSPNSGIINTHHSTTTDTEKGASMVDQGPVETQDVSVSGLADVTTASPEVTANTSSGKDLPQTARGPSGLSVEWADSVDDRSMDEAVLQISGAGHWFQEGWIGNHSVDFLVDSGSAMTALSCSFYQTLVRAGAPMGALRTTPMKLRGTNGSIDILGSSSCVVSFLGLQTEFHILVCDLSTDAIIGTDTLGSVLPHTLDIKNGLLFTEGGMSLQLHRMDAALSGRVFTVGHCSIPLYSEAVLHCTTRMVGGRSMPSSGLLEGLTVFAENTGLVVGRTLVDPSVWRIPVLVSNFSQETVMVEPFSEIGMVAQVSAIQPVMDWPSRSSCDPLMLLDHLQGLLDQTSQDLDGSQRGQLASTLLQFVDLFPVPGSALTGHMDAVEHTIDTGHSTPIRCALAGCLLRRLNRKRGVAEMLAGGQIEPSDSPCSAPVVLVTKKDGGTRFCVDYRRLNLATVKDAYPLPRIDDTLDMLAGKQWFSTLDLASGYWQVSLSPDARCKTAFATHSGLFQFKVMPFGLYNAPATFEQLMDRALQGLCCSLCLVYLDDIISFGTTFEDTLDNLKLIFERLCAYGLQLKLTKCHLFRTSVSFLGHIVDHRGLECDPKMSSPGTFQTV